MHTSKVCRVRVAHRGDGFAVEGLRPGRQRGEEQKQQNCTFFHHNSLRFYGRCTGRRTTAKVSRIIGIGLPGKNGSKGTKKQENGKGYEKISKSGPENRRGTVRPQKGVRTPATGRKALRKRAPPNIGRRSGLQKSGRPPSVSLLHAGSHRRGSLARKPRLVEARDFYRIRHAFAPTVLPAAGNSYFPRSTFFLIRFFVTFFAVDTFLAILN